MKKTAAVGNRKLSDFTELRDLVIAHTAAVRRLKK